MPNSINVPRYVLGENKHMSTTTKTATEVTVAASSKVTALIVAQISAAVTAFSKKRQTAEGIRSEADRLGYDRKQASEMALLSWVEAFNMSKASEADLKRFTLKSRPDVSKVLALAYPDKPAELGKAYAHNDKLPANSPKHNRIGENNLLRIARGEATTAEVLNAKAEVKRQSSLDATFTPQERFQNSIAGVLASHKVATKGHISSDEATEAFNVALDAYLNPPKKAATKK